MNANFAIGPVIHRPPSQPVTILESAEHSLDFLLAGIADGHLLGSPVHAIGEQHGATQAMIHEPLPGRGIELELQPPSTIPGFELIANDILQKLAGEPTLNLAANLVLFPASLRL